MKTINQYKSAMDNIKISDSFVSRTEALLSEQKNSESLSGKHKRNGLQITMWSGIAAACVIGALLVRAGIIRQETQNDITIGTDITSSVTTEMTAAPADVGMQLDIEEDDAFDGLDINSGTTEAMTPTEKASDAGKVAETTHTVKSEGEQPRESKANEPALPEDAKDEMVMAAAGGIPESTSESADFAASLYTIDFSSCTAEIESYINDKTQSLIVALNGDEAKNYADMIADMIYSTEPEEKNPEFVSEFVLTISDNSTIYTIYLTQNGEIVVNTNFDGEQDRSTYVIPADSFTDIERSMFIKFGTDEDYDTFNANRG